MAEKRDDENTAAQGGPAYSEGFSKKSARISIDVSKLSIEQRKELQVRLKDLARGIAPDRFGSLIGAEGGHVSHNDTDGWF